MSSPKCLGLDIAKSLEDLCKSNGKCAAELQGSLAKLVWTPSDRKQLMNSLASHILDDTCTVAIGKCFRSLLPDLLIRCQSHLYVNGELQWHVHQQLSVALSTLLSINAYCLGYTLEYIRSHPPFYKTENPEHSTEPQSKKQKKMKNNKPSQIELLKAVLQFGNYLNAEVKSLWNWTDFLQMLHSKDLNVRWLALKCVGILSELSPIGSQRLEEKYFSRDEQLSLRLRFENAEDLLKSKLDLLRTAPGIYDECSEDLKYTKKMIVESDMNDEVVSVAGVLLKKLSIEIENKRDFEKLVPVASTMRNLSSIALAVGVGDAVLLEGPVGSGKTSLVEHLAHLTGRHGTPHLLTVQLGDQTDSRTLLGTYRCTDIAGEFVWQPGSLTQAVTEGHWLLLEDLDYAPMDVLSILVPLLQSRTLSIPGHGDNVKAHPAFQLFATQRLLSSGSGWFKQHGGILSILDKMWTKVTVEPMSRLELQQVIVSKYQHLSTVVERLLDIYFLLSAGRHELSPDVAGSDSESDVGKYLSRDGRLISTRDLMKWCSRIQGDFSVSDAATGDLVFQEAIDCFASSLDKDDRLLGLAEAIGAKLNINKAKVEFYCQKHKPNISIEATVFNIGRAGLRRKVSEVAQISRGPSSSFAFTRQSVTLLERVAVAVSYNEPVLLVGETGTGKTSTVQYLAQKMGHFLRVINMNQQSDSTDLLGGFKPVDLTLVMAPFREEFETAFCKTFSRKQNMKFLGHIQMCFSKKRWNEVLSLFEHTLKSAIEKYEEGSSMRKRWMKVKHKLAKLKLQVKQTESSLAFSFIEGSLVRGLKNGDWVLLDEINLAAAETLECLSGLLESHAGSIVLMDRGDTNPITRHPDFRLFACMNPATDVGKKDLPPGIRNRFTEFYVGELEDKSDLKVLVSEYLKGLSLTAGQVEGIVKFYLQIKKQAVKKLTDGTGHRPHYSLRTLCRALKQAASNLYGSVPRSLYEAFCLSFLTEVDRSSYPVVESLIREHVLNKVNMRSLLKQATPEPSKGKYLQFESYWVPVGNLEPAVPEGYVLTPSVRANLKDLTRVVSAGGHPVLIQGETSVGKTSLITWLAASSGNTCVRINNHEHTDLQEYVGCYTADDSGKLMFKEGVLVEAMRKGYWIILDELNLAPTDVLEALNRLLDDNRELFIGETQEVVKAHPRFMLFATQNPPGHYGGRKVLSRAFRNRFVELHFDEIPSAELETILHDRCQIPKSYCKRLVKILLELQTRRRSSGVFAGKQGFITLRDLFRWAERYHRATYDIKEKFFDWDQQLADNGYMLLAGRVRKPEECIVIQEVLEKHLKRKVDPQLLFTLSEKTSPTSAPLLQKIEEVLPEEFRHVVWTFNMRRMAVLVGQALKFDEPVLLVGETGCGKTTICQIFSKLYDQQLYSVNCHLHTETSDFLGGLRPVRSHQESIADEQEAGRLFEWVDGPLVTAMKDGCVFLMDEISLADDSVLERLNSVLEPERTLLLAEKAGGTGTQDEDIPKVTANKAFKFVATMNPGGDYGKKELSPALRNRMTEIWCPLSLDREDLVMIIEHNLSKGIVLNRQNRNASGIGEAIMDFVEWFSNKDFAGRCVISIRDLLSWVRFINQTSRRIRDVKKTISDWKKASAHQLLDPAVAYIHGACLVFLDALGTGTSGSSYMKPGAAKELCVKFLIQQIETLTQGPLDPKTLSLDATKTIRSEDYFMIPPFNILVGDAMVTADDQYALNAPTTCRNGQRVLRALQLSRPILLEGSPGVGKTSLVAALARASGHNLVRINLSEQTDVSDLFGADLPVEGGQGGLFSWRDGPLLAALKAGHWVVLDELNLASQSVLEGLNACLDHRGEVFIPELGKSFLVQHGKTRFFACQNPLHQGGGRKGLPKSFLNRFTQVYVEPLTRDDLLFITEKVFPQLDAELRGKMVDFNNKMHEETVELSEWGHRGGPWEFNLRDIFRWCELLLRNQVPGTWDAGEYVHLMYAARMRTHIDKERVFSAYKAIFAIECQPYKGKPEVHLSSEMLQIGHSFLTSPPGGSNRQSHSRHLKILHHNLMGLELLSKCIQMGWMSILVGPSSSGKTSIVQVLASLSGHHLNVLHMNSEMDTTELLGGFEQADMARHLDEIKVEVEKLVNQVTSALLLNLTFDSGSGPILTRLMAAWTKFLNAKPADDSVAVGAEMETMRRRIEMLREVIQLMHSSSAIIEQSSFHEGLGRIEGRLGDLWRRVMEDGRVQQAGRFEWVDSLLVKSLQQGHWLLIDNVNFCSPSVLDRLNGLLEPNGVLSINERGVIDGQVPTIEPHPEFRLILAMDPKYGEISRAMRNRGVEIYLLGEDEGYEYSEYDIKEMFESLGLAGDTTYKALSHIHKTMKSILTDCSILDLLQAAHLTQQQMDRGVDLRSAISRSAMDVYIRTQHDLQLRQKCHDTLKQILEETDMSEKTLEQDYNISRLVRPSPSVYDLTQDVALSTVINNCRLLQRVISRSVLTEEDQTQDDPPSSANKDLVIPTIQVILERTCPAHADLAVGLLSQKVLPSFSPDLRKRQDLIAVGLQCLDRVLKSNLKVVAHHNLVTKAQEIKSQLGLPEQELTMLNEQALDIRWNRALMKKLEGCYSSQCEVLHAISNQLAFLLQLSRRQITYTEGLGDNLKSSKKTQASFLQQSKTRASFLHMSYLYHRGSLDAEALPDAAVVHLYPFITQLLDNLSEKWSVLTQVTDEQLTQLLEGLWWLDSFVDVCRSPVYNRQWPTTLSRLALHWNWIVGRCLPYILPDEKQSKGLQTVMNFLQTTLGIDHEASRLHLQVWRAQGHPAPYLCEENAALTLALLKLAAQGELKVTDTNNNSHVKFALEKLPEFRQLVLQGLYWLLCNPLEMPNQEEFADLQTKLREMLLAGKVIIRPEAHSADQDICLDQVDSLKVNMWPIYDLCALLTHHGLLPRLLQDQANRSSLVAFSTTLSNSASTSTEILMNLQPLCSAESDEETGEKDFGLLLHHLMKSLSTSTALQNTDKWLSWQPNESQGNDVVHNVVHNVELTKLVTKSIHTLLLSHMAFTLISDLKGQCHMNDDSWLPGCIAVGKMKEKVDQLQQLSKVVWQHSGAFASHWNVRSNNMRLLMSVTTKIIGSLRPLLAEEEQDEFIILCENIPSLLESSEPDETCLSSLRTSLHSIKAKLCVVGSGLETITETLPDVLGAFVSSHNEASSGRVIEDSKWLTQVFTSAQLWMIGGILQSNMLQPQGPVDPAYKQSVKLDYAKRQINQVDAELTVRNESNFLFTGMMLDLDDQSELHPHLCRLLLWQQTIQQQMEELEKNQALRPQPSQFSLLLKDVKQFMSSVGKAGNLIQLMNKFSDIVASLMNVKKTKLRIEMVLNEGKAICTSLKEFSNKMMAVYPLYKDLLVPFIAGLDMVSYGIQELSFCAETVHGRLAVIPRHLHGTDSENLLLENLMSQICSFPTQSQGHVDLISLVMGLLSEDVFGVIANLQLTESTSKSEGTKTVSPHMVSSLLRICLQYTSIHSQLNGHLDQSSLACLFQVFDAYLSSWQKMEAERKDKQEMEESLYHFKTKEHGSDLTEEERDQISIKETFPSFTKEYEDITEVNVMDDKVEDVPVAETEDEVMGHISEHLMTELCQHHLLVFPTLTSCNWIEKKDVDAQLDLGNKLLQPALLSYKLGAELSRHLNHLIASTVDGKLIGSHLLASQVLQNLTKMEESNMAVKQERPYDIYKDPNISEVVQCLPVLALFETRVKELQAEWPDHPTLKTIVLVIDRIRSFSVTDPLMKFVTGLELLLDKAQEWEENAAKFVSLSNHSEEVSRLVIQWRKIELRCWRGCLDTTEWKIKQKATKWWFHLYQLIQSYISPESDAKDSNTQMNAKDLLKAFQQFMEQSSIGEFEKRLELLFSFHCQLVNMERTAEQEVVMHILWNVYQYYNQFSHLVSNRVQKIRDPVEKDLKGFVKIARWNDINFWSLKITVEKTKQTLHKFIKRYSQGLQEPVKAVFTDTMQQGAVEASKAVATAKSFSLGKPVVPSLPKCFMSNLPETSLLHKLPHLTVKAAKHINTIFDQMEYFKLASKVDGFTGEIIESIQELRVEVVCGGPNKDKLKSDAKLKQQQKRKALADLFKYLQHAGLSYRKGLHSLSEADLDKVFRLPAVDVQAALKQNAMGSHDEATANSWEGCNYYLYRSVARQALFLMASAQPAADLGPPNIAKCKGFAQNLMDVSLAQRRGISDVVDNFVMLRKYVQAVENTSSEITAHHETVDKWMIELKTVIDQCILGLTQTQMLMQCCPQEGVTICSPLPSDDLSPISMATSGCSLVEEALSKVKDMLNSLIIMKRQNDAVVSAKEVIKSRDNVHMLKDGFEKLAEISEQLGSIVSKLAPPVHSNGNVLISGMLTLKDQIDSRVSEFTNVSLTESADGNESLTTEKSVDVSFHQLQEDIVQEVLLAQRLAKQEQSPSEDESKDEDDSSDLEEGHLTKHLTDSLRIQVAKLNIDKVCKMLQQLVDSIRNGHASGLTPMVESLKPLLKQYSNLIQCFVTASVTAHRTTLKLLSVLLSIFTELAQKGFCPPADYSDEVKGEGATEFQDIQDGGLGEGEGVKDVSDKIESEDQLEDAKQKGQEQEEPAEQKEVAEEDNAIEMSEDFEGKTHDLDKQDPDEEKEEDESKEPNEEEIDRQMGDLDEEDANKLDEQMWGDDEEKEEEEEKKDKKEEQGQGDSQESETSIVAKDDNDEKDPGSKDDKEKQPQQPEKDEENEEKIHEQIDEREYDENEVDPHYGKEENQQAPEPMDLPEDLNLDEEGEDEEKEEGQEKEENPFDIDGMPEEGKQEEEEMEEGKDEKEGNEEETEGKEEKEQDAEGGEDNNNEDDKTEEQTQESAAENEEQKDSAGAPEEERGPQPQEQENERKTATEDESTQEDKDEAPMASDAAMTTDHDVAEVQQSEGAKDNAGQQDQQEEQEGVGVTQNENDDGHYGDSSTQVAEGSSGQQKQKMQQRPGKSDTNRTLGTTAENVQRRLKTVDTSNPDTQQQNEKQKSELYEHIKDADSHFDAQTMDVATDDQQQQQPVPNMKEEETEELADDDVDMMPDDSRPETELTEAEKLQASKLTKPKKDGDDRGEEDMETQDGEGHVKVDGEKIDTMSVRRGPISTMHTAMEFLDSSVGELDIEALRHKMEEGLQTFSLSEMASEEETKLAQEAWQQYDAITGTLSRELCEQLRLVLEPTQASKLRGDYRTGKRLNMRKVIPYIASQFRKDKIWLRRTKPSKRQYQVVLAVDDSSSMADNHSRQLAFESLALISNALTFLEVGELAVCSFGENVKLLHSFHEQFSGHSGARILQQMTFDQKKTNIAKLLDYMTSMMLGARVRQQGAINQQETSQLLLVLSDGRGLFMEGIEVVRQAVRQAREANVFLVFVIIDNPENKDSILDIKVPVFQPDGQLAAIHSYMESFPFPFYIILRDINNLPNILSDALRQWFELVTTTDR